MTLDRPQRRDQNNTSITVVAYWSFELHSQQNSDQHKSRDADSRPFDCCTMTPIVKIRRSK